MRTIVTTAGRSTEFTVMLAKEAATKLKLPYIDRQKRTVTQMQHQYKSNVLVASKKRWEYYGVDTKEPFFFHPSSAMFRLKRLTRGEIDPLIEVCTLFEGDSFLDCTLGYASDSLIAAFIVGESGSVTGCEASPVLAFILEEAFHSHRTDHVEYFSLMQRIKVVSEVAITYLKVQPDDSFDVVYMDPMFESTIEESGNINPLRHVGHQDVLTEEWVKEAVRVAKKRVVLKTHFRSQWFEQYGFNRIIRKNTKFHYGYIDCIEKSCPQ